MAVSSYGSGTKSSGVVRILKDLDTDITGRHVLIVDEIIDTGLTLSWLISNLASRNAGVGARSAPCSASRRRVQMDLDVKYVGWDIPNEFVVGYGLDYNERYRNLRDIGTLAPARLLLTRSARASAIGHPAPRTWLTCTSELVGPP